MVSMKERYPSTGFFKAADFEDTGDEGIDLTIDRLDLDVPIGVNTRDVLRFIEDGRGLTLNQTNAMTLDRLFGDSDNWPDKRVNLFLDRTVKFNDEIKPGIRVRPLRDSTTPRPAPPPRPAPKPAPTKPDFDDEIPF
jgi:hypothetical protein